MRGRPKTELVLSDAELTALTLRRKTAQALALRARIVLGCAERMENKLVAVRQRVTPQTVSKWRASFVKHRLDGLIDAPRSGALRSIDDARVDAVIARTLESLPEGATHWSTRRMAREMDLSQTAVTRIWHAFGLQPHRQETFKLSTDPMFVDKVREHRRAVPGSSTQGDGAVRGRENANSGARLHPADLAAGARHSRTQDA